MQIVGGGIDGAEFQSPRVAELGPAIQSMRLSDAPTFHPCLESTVDTNSNTENDGYIQGHKKEERRKIKNA